MSKRTPLWSIMMALALSACTNTPVAGCPNDLPASCVTPVPSYQTVVSPIFGAYCVTCHSPGGQGASVPLESYAQIYSLRSEVLDQIYSCRMPTPGAPQPSEAERLAVLQWLVCGAPEN